MPVPDAIAYVRAALPPPPARVLEIGAGNGELAAARDALVGRQRRPMLDVADEKIERGLRVRKNVFERRK